MPTFIAVENSFAYARVSSGNATVVWLSALRSCYSRARAKHSSLRIIEVSNDFSALKKKKEKKCPFLFYRCSEKMPYFALDEASLCHFGIARRHRALPTFAECTIPVSKPTFSAQTTTTRRVMERLLDRRAHATRQDVFCSPLRRRCSALESLLYLY